MKLIELLNSLNNVWYKKYGLDVKFIPIERGAQLQITYKGSQFCVLLKPSEGKFKLDFSQVKNDKIENELKSMLDGSFVPSDDPLYVSQRPESLVAGFDESGNGSVFGGIMFAGVFSPQPHEKVSAILEGIGVKDSKELDDGDIVRLANLIEELPNFYVVSNYCEPEELNRLQFEEKLSINQIMQKYHGDTINQIFAIDNITLPNVVLIDQFCDEDWFGTLKINGTDLVQSSDLRYRTSQFGNDFGVVVEQMTHGEREMLVAAASIIARDRILREFNTLSLRYGVEFPHGSSKPAKSFYHNVIKDKYPDDELKKIMKLAYKIQ
jgi:ribonuclease HIII